MGGSATGVDEWVTFERAVRIVGPLAGGIGHGRARIFRALEAGGIETKALQRPPSYAGMGGVQELSKEWFRLANHTPGPASKIRWLTWRPRFNAWLQQGLALRKADVETLDGSTYNFTEAENRQLRGTVNWSLTQTLSWITTRKWDVVLQVAYREGWRAPSDAWQAVPKATELQIAKAAAENKTRNAIGWLIRSVADSHCRCGSFGDDVEEKWQRCTCLVEPIADLKAKLRSGLIVASSIVADHYREALCIDFTTFSIQPAILDGISFDRSEVQRLWPAHGTVTDQQIREWIAVYPGLNSRSAWKAIRRAFPDEGISEKRFLPLWVAEKGKRLPGRPKNSTAKPRKPPFP